jgi:hypothetical protein
LSDVGALKIEPAEGHTVSSSFQTENLRCV